MAAHSGLLPLSELGLVLFLTRCRFVAFLRTQYTTCLRDDLFNGTELLSKLMSWSTLVRRDTLYRWLIELVNKYRRVPISTVRRKPLVDPHTQPSRDKVPLVLTVSCKQLYFICAGYPPKSRNIFHVHANTIF